MTRFKLTIEYDGRSFVGWQAQENGPSVQAALETAVERLTGVHSLVYGSGRTDAGVHATGQVAHVDIEKELTADQLANALNYHLKPNPIAIVGSQALDEAFHARFGATKRYYSYRIVNRRAPLTFDRGLAWQIPQPLDADAMDEAAKYLIGNHDFTTFRHAHCQAKSPIKTVDLLLVERDGEDIWISAQARSFLHHQIRSFVGCLALVGRGKWQPEDVKSALEARDRSRLGLNAPPDGLYFTQVDYGPTSKDQADLLDHSQGDQL